MSKILQRRGMLPPQVEALLQRIRDRLRCGIIPPEGGISALGDRIMQLEELDDPLPMVAEGFVELTRRGVHRAARAWQAIGDRVHRRLDQHQRGRLQRFKKARR